MAKIKGSVPVAGFIGPTDDSDVFPVTVEEYQQGGYRTVAKLDDLDRITPERCKDGMLVFVYELKKFYQRLDGQWNVADFGVVSDATGITPDDLANLNLYTKDEVNNLLSPLTEGINTNRGNITNLRTDVDNKANSDDVYNKTDADDRFAVKTDVYSKTEADGKFALKTNVAELEARVDGIVVPDAYTKTEVDEKVANAVTNRQVDLSNYVDLTKLEEILNAKLAGYVPRNELTEIDVYTKEEIDNLLAQAGKNLTYTNDTPVTANVGGITAGTTYENTPIKDILDALLHPYQKPAFTSFSLNNKVVEVGTGITTNNYSWAISNVDNAKLETLSLTLDGQPLTIADKIANGNNVTIANINITKNTPASATATISANNSKDEAFSANATISWKYKMYTGVSTKTVLNANEIKALNSKLVDNAKGVHNYTGSGYQYLVYPAAWGMPENIRDNKTGFGFSYVKLDNINVESNGITVEYIVIRSNEYLNSVVPLIVS